MAYIYQITNKLNNKIYIGKTEFSIEKRFKEHCKDAFRREEEKRPLYAAMRKYGIENFEISLIEETNNPEEREIFWIEQKRSFKQGYNATMGGDGTKYIDYDLVIATYNELKSIVDTAKQLQISEDSVSKILKQNNIQTYSSAEVNLQKYGNIIYQYDKDMNFIQSFTSIKSAAKSLNKTGVSHISDVCKGKRKTAYGFIWRYGDHYLGD